MAAAEDITVAESKQPANSKKLHLDGAQKDAPSGNVVTLWYVISMPWSD